jgi:hypothetical protein
MLDRLPMKWKGTWGTRIERVTKTHLLGFACALGDPLLGFFPSFVEGEETSLAATLDELIWLCDELGVENPARELRVRGDGTSRGVPGNLSDLWGREDQICLDCRRWVDGGSTLKPVGEKQLCVVLADGWERR